MSGDIVERLRNVFPIGWEGEMRHKAADEIERLQGALRQIGMPGVQIGYCSDGHEMAVMIARAALGEDSHD